MRSLSVICLAVLIVLSGCASTRYSLVAAGPVAVQTLIVDADSGWNRAPSHHTQSARENTVTWTKDGMLLDRMVIIPGVPDGEAILRSQSDSAALPVFRADMLPNEIEELVESSVLKRFGEGQATLSTDKLRPHRFGANMGMMFDLSATVTDSPAYRGIAGAFIADDKLYMMYFLGAVPYYFDKHKNKAEDVIKSARLYQE
ncbi:MAG: hypothetical protein ACR2Q3_00540 [Woeseiaceae bacterium]